MAKKSRSKKPKKSAITKRKPANSKKCNCGKKSKKFTKSGKSYKKKGMGVVKNTSIDLNNNENNLAQGGIVHEKDCDYLSDSGSV